MTFLTNGGVGGGGQGSVIVSGESGAANTGSGGGGVGTSTLGNTGGSGGSGVVVVRYLTGGAVAGQGGTVSVAGEYTVHVFNTSATFTVIPISDIIPVIDTTNQLTNLIEASLAGLTTGRAVTIFNAEPVVGPSNKNLTYRFSSVITTTDRRFRSLDNNVANENTRPVLVYIHAPPVFTSQQVIFNRENSNYIAATATVNTVRESINYVRPATTNAFPITFANRPVLKNTLLPMISNGSIVKNVFSETNFNPPLIERSPDVSRTLVVTDSLIVTRTRITLFSNAGASGGSSKSFTSAPFGTAGVFVGGDGQLLIRGATEFWS